MQYLRNSANDCRLEKVYQTSKKNLDGPRKFSRARLTLMLTIQNPLSFTRTTFGVLYRPTNYSSSVSRMAGNRFARS